MPWFPVDDSFYSHPKALATSLAARGLWATAGSWSSAHLTDGAVPDHVLGSLGGTPELADELCAAGLWRRTRRGYVFHDWLDWGSKHTAKEIRQLRRVRAEAGRTGGLASGRARTRKSENAKQTATKTGFASPPDRTEPGHPNPDEQGKQASKTEANLKQVASQLVGEALNPNTSSYTHTALSGPSPPPGARDPNPKFSDVKPNGQASRLPSARTLTEALRDAGVPPDHQPASDQAKAAIAAQARQALNRRTPPP